MDKYEELLNEKIGNAKRDFITKINESVSTIHLHELRGQIEAYEDALNEYRRMKNESVKSI